MGIVSDTCSEFEGRRRQRSEAAIAVRCLERMCEAALPRYQLLVAAGDEGQQALARSNVTVSSAARDKASLLSNVVASSCDIESQRTRPAYGREPISRIPSIWCGRHWHECQSSDKRSVGAVDVQKKSKMKVQSAAARETISLAIVIRLTEVRSAAGNAATV